MNYTLISIHMSRIRTLINSVLTANESDDSWYIMLRVGASAALIGKVLSEWSYVDLLYGSHGFVPVDIARFSQNEYIPTILGLLKHIAAFCPETVFLKLFFGIILIAGVSLLLQYKTRLAALICWLMMVITFNSSHLTSYGFDAVLITLLFYTLVLGHGRYSPVYHKAIQLHICLIYFVNGISKMSGQGWHDGSGLWDAIHQPQYLSILSQPLRKFLQIDHVAAAMSWSVILTEVAYPFLIWVRKINAIVFILIILLHCFIAIVMGLWLFAFTMIVFNLVAFGHILKKEKV